MIVFRAKVRLAHTVINEPKSFEKYHTNLDEWVKHSNFSDLLILEYIFQPFTGQHSILNFKSPLWCICYFSPGTLSATSEAQWVTKSFSRRGYHSNRIVSVALSTCRRTFVDKESSGAIVRITERGMIIYWCLNSFCPGVTRDQSRIKFIPSDNSPRVKKLMT